MKILFLEAVQNYGGARKSTVELASRLRNSNHEILIVDFWGSCVPFTKAINDNNLNYKILDKSDEPFLLSTSTISKKIINYLRYTRLWLTYKKRIKMIISEFKPDLIVVNNTKTLSILPKSKSFKISYFARGWFLPHTISLFNKFLIKRNVDFFIGVSQATRAAIYAGGFSDLNNIYVVQNAINFENIEEIEKTNNYISWENSINRPINLFHCGGFLPSKGQDVMIEIAKELRKRQVSFHVKLAGIVYKGDKSEKFLKNIQETIEKDSLQDNFSFVINEPDVLKEFYTMDVLVHPSSTEGLPRVVMESMAFAKPVIANPVGGVSDYILNDYNGYITNYNSIKDYCDAIEKLYKNKEHYKYISNNAISLIKNSFTENNQTKQFQSVIDNIL